MATVKAKNLKKIFRRMRKNEGIFMAARRLELLEQEETVKSKSPVGSKVPPR